LIRLETKLEYLEPLRSQLIRLETKLAYLEPLRSQLTRLEIKVERLEQLRSELTYLETGIASLQQELDAATGRPLRPLFSYSACHDRVGGTEEQVRSLYTPLVDLFSGCQNVLDIGCGQGVFLRLLKEKGISGYGVDMDLDMVRSCQATGLKAVQAEALAHLRLLGEDSLGGIFCAHLIEHLPKARLVPFLELCHSRLQPEAPIILITPNGAGLTIFHYTFYKDLTHNQPLHPEAVKFLLENAGFRQIDIQFLSPMPEESKLHPLPLQDLDPDQAALAETLNEDLEKLNELLYGPLDCTFVARK